ncbi:hypothetical protein PoB_001195300 [Plakobranchus ocellatus]|uniref:Peptidase A2 domain-containing protein n=1 Tax=Plakobranchus ocellatus TaxID=259542 RepID=A0AAV3YT57_9GAST|nr:hypothetical protein PoB_001195300 [Plakobranchus ocellatus]
MKVDTGAETSTIPAKLWEKIKRKPRLRESRMTLKAFGNTKIENEGTATVHISVGEKQIRTEIFVTKGQTTPILGLQACMKLNLIQKGKNGQHIQANAIDLVKKEKTNKRPNPLTKQDLQEQFPDLFEGLGSYNAQYHIHLKEKAVPVNQPPRRVPGAIMPELKQKLKEMEENGIIEVVDEPTEWLHNLVIAQKPDGRVGSTFLVSKPIPVLFSLRISVFQSPFGSVLNAERTSDMFQAEFALNSATPMAAHLQKIGLVALEARSPRQRS